MQYHYWTVRYVPDVFRGEFVNVGLLVGSNEGGWAFREVSSLRRATRLGGDPIISRYWLAEIRRLVEISNAAEEGDREDGLWLPGRSEPAGMTEETVQHLRGRLNNTVQISASSVVVAESAVQGLDLLFEHLVADPQPATRTQFRSRISQQIETLFYHGLLDDHRARVERRPQVHVGRSNKTADLAITDGAVEQLTKAWSFNLSNVESVQTEIEAWAYFMDRIRDKGARLTTVGKNELIVPEDVQLRVIYEEPNSSQRAENVSAAQEIWARVPGLKTYSSSQASELVKDGLDLVA